MNVLKSHRLLEKLVCKYNKSWQPQRKLFSTFSPLLIVSLLISNWYILYNANLDALPLWFIWLADSIYQFVPGAHDNVMYSLRLRYAFKYIYAINFIFFILVFTLTLFFVDKSSGLIKNNRLKTNSDVVFFYLAYSSLFIVCLFMISIFFFGFTLEEAKTLADVPKTSAGGAAIGFRMYETRFGAMTMYSLVHGWGAPFLLGTILHVFIRFSISLFRIFVKSSKRKCL